MNDYPQAAPEDPRGGIGPAPTETKVVAAAGGATGGGVLAALVVYLLDTLVYTPQHNLGDTVPPVVLAAVYVVLAAVGAWVAGRAAPHTPRPGA